LWRFEPKLIFLDFFKLRFRVFETWGPGVDVLNVVAYSSRFEVRPHVLVWLVLITVRLPNAHQMVLRDLQYRNLVLVMLWQLLTTEAHNHFPFTYLFWLSTPALHVSLLVPLHSGGSCQHWLKPKNFHPCSISFFLSWVVKPQLNHSRPKRVSWTVTRQLTMADPNNSQQWFRFGVFPLTVIGHQNASRHCS